ncbi:RNA polymerase II-associated protein 3-like [Dendronephthya gigantea]|uniref:RNA polymerase II-associated protein 3-like n=1 Tax=Dendronephthya gigantea TaxID=151771 RepID=UPI00106D454A|nr:RNA polymerase II-associated protein 3-like [Dendronephthya gigantea]
MADAVNLQYQVRQNNEELQDYLKDLYKWEDEVQAQDKLLANSKTPLASSHPVRNKTRKKKPKSILKQTPASTKERLKGSNFQAWDKYDVEKALKEIDDQEDLETQSTSDEDSEDEDVMEHRRLQQALFEKEKGNDLFKEGKYEAAINRYTTAIGLDPNNAILPANRAMALIKVQRYGAAIQDCDTALALDNTYVKAFARRATAKYSLGRLKEAMEDYEMLLKLHPCNKQALDGIKEIQKMLTKQLKDSKEKNEQTTVELQKKQKPMKRYLIEEIGVASSDEEENTSMESKSDLIEKLSNLGSPLVNNAASVPVKTIGENTKNSKTIEDHNHLAKPAITDEVFASIPQNCNTSSQHKPDVLKDCSNPNTSLPSSCYTDHTITNCKLTPPISSIQFQTTWKQLEKNPDLLYSYMKIIPPDQLPKVMGESVESSLLINIFTILHNYYVRDCHPIFDVLNYISQVKRFSMTMMFLSVKEKSVVKDLFVHLETLPENNKTFTKNELQALKLKYGVR